MLMVREILNAATRCRLPGWATHLANVVMCVQAMYDDNASNTLDVKELKNFLGKRARSDYGR